MPRRTPAQLAHRTYLWRAYAQNRTQTNRDALVREYRPLVYKTRAYIVPTIPVRISGDDLEQEGQIALIKAVDLFDPRRKVKFESYAISLIRGAMLEYLRREDWVPRSVRSKQKRLTAAESAVALQRGPQAVTAEALAAQLELPIDAFYQLYAEATVLQVISFDDVVGDAEHDDNDVLLVLEHLKSTEPDPSAEAFVEQQRALLAQCIRWLPDQERQVVQWYYFEGLTLKECARQLGRSQSRAHQLHSQAIGRLGGFLARERGLWFPEVLPMACGLEVAP